MEHPECEEDAQSTKSGRSIKYIGRGERIRKFKLHVEASGHELFTTKSEDLRGTSRQAPQVGHLASQVDQLFDELNNPSSTFSSSQLTIKSRKGKRKAVHGTPSNGNKRKRARMSKIPETPDEKLVQLRKNFEGVEEIESTPIGKMNRGKVGRIEQKLSELVKYSEGLQAEKERMSVSINKKASRLLVF